MVSPPSQRLWVGMLVVFVVVVVELPGALPKCIFDEVQVQVRVVEAAPVDPDSPPSKTRLRALAGQEPQTANPGFKGSPLQAVKQRSSLGGLVPPTAVSPLPIRIRTWVPEQSDSLSEAEKDRLEAAVEEAIPDDHLAGCDVYPEADSPRRTALRPEGAGLPDTDFLLYLHVQATDKCRAEPNVLAYAVHCQTDTHGRPVAGVVVICRDGLSGAAYSHHTTVQTVIHELFHVLGFSKDLFHTWRDCSSSSQGVGCSPRGKVTHTDGSGQMRIYTPSVISALQKHLASTDPELGGPLENLDASPGGVSSHWESRLLQGSIMAAVLGDSTTVRIDPITLAALEDTGWYAVNLSRAQSLVWGDGEGATFGSLSTCHNSSSSFFCTGSGLGCHYLHLHKGECQTDPYLEKCSMYKPLKNGSECWKKENERQSAEKDWSGEIFGFDSRCFFSSLNRQSHFILSSGSVEGRCYRHRCTGPNRYQIQVFGSEWVDCPAGGTIQINGYQGSVFCPDRFCLYADVTPSHDVNTFPASITSDPFQTLTSAQDGTWFSLRPPTEVTVVTALCFTAAVCLLAAVMVSYRKCCSYRVRIHTAPEDHSNL
ncbi:ciliated left-right organizer metallopeptidase [Scomber japonicus]|uniref:ciliated left-right organizer metallopeptidase n=1 Tax=Scomber japonicus TaxID=13676 RepID=UPI002305E5B8|nr:ciliated left-right organizer metallopeptidase [Scomber japonicus]